MTHVFSNDAFWIKAAGFMFWAKRSPPLFSERNGYERFIKLPFTRWRFQLKKLTTNKQGAMKQ